MSKEEEPLLTAVKHGTNLAGVYEVEKADREELEIAYQTLNAVFASTPDGLIVLDDTLIIQQANRAFGRLVELAPETIVGRLITDVFPADELVTALQQMASSAESDDVETVPSQLEISLSRPLKRFLLAHVARLRAGRTQGWIVVLHEQSRQRRLENQKIEFVNIAAHELITPLNIVLGFADMLAAEMEAKASDEEMGLLQAIKQGGYRLQMIVNELLEFAQVQEGSVEPESVVEFDLNDLLRETSAELQQLARSKRVRLEVPALGQPLLLHTNRKLLRTAVYQLIVNAINFNKPGGFVRVTAVPLDGHVTIDIEDSGVGIPQTELDAIFSSFFQVEEHNTRHIGGLGLGLSMARRAVHQLGGDLSVDSSLDAGSTFSLDVPVKLAEPADELSELRSRLDASYQQSLIYARHIQELKRQLQRHFMATLKVMAEAIEARDVYTRGHSDRVTDLALRLAGRLGYSEQALRRLEMAGRIHDLGKIGTPDALLTKSRSLSPDEFERVKQHVALGRKILEPLEFLHEVLPIAFSHHERWDGKGYPEGLAGEAIPLGGRILAIADAYNAMTSPRSYREAIPHKAALAIIRQGAGAQWDPGLVGVFTALMTDEESNQ
jgi:PAS domain S-box-containing protein